MPTIGPTITAFRRWRQTGKFQIFAKSEHLSAGTSACRSLEHVFAPPRVIEIVRLTFQGSAHDER